MCVHASAVHSKDRFRHEGGVKLMPEGYDLCDIPQGYDAVRRGERIGIMKIDLMLASRRFVM